MSERTETERWEMLAPPGLVRVAVPTTRVGRVWIPAAEGESEVRAEFKLLTYGDNVLIDRLASVDVDAGGDKTRTVAEPNERRALLLRRTLLAWTLDVPVEREDGWLSESCYERVCGLCGPLVDVLVEQFDQKCSVTKDEENEIMRQSAILFSKNSHGVSDACDAVTLFCNLGNYSEKFGLTPEALWDFPYRDFMRLKIMVNRESTLTKASQPKPSNTMIAGGRRTRPSRGVTVRQ